MLFTVHRYQMYILRCLIYRIIFKSV